MIGSFYNLMPEMFVNLYSNLQTGKIDEAKKIQEKINIIILYALEKSGYPFIKMGLKWMDIDSGYVRRPFINITDTDMEEQIKKELKILTQKNDLSGVKFLETL